LKMTKPPCGDFWRRIVIRSPSRLQPDFLRGCFLTAGMGYLRRWQSPSLTQPGSPGGAPLSRGRRFSVGSSSVSFAIR
jgi:hypothetical protein